MGIESSIRDLQDKVRNAGWRIEHIPWQELGRPEYVHNTPLTLLTGLGGAALFVGSTLMVATRHAPGWVLGIGMLGLAIAILGRLYASRRKQADWVRVDARCEDREVREVRVAVGGRLRPAWAYRLRCRFWHQGQDYEVTPDPSNLMQFQSEARISAYLEECIDPDGRCTLWVNPRNPLQTTFHDRQKI